MSLSITEEVKKQAGLLSVVGAVGGFISDVLQPIAPLSYYVFIVSICATALLLFSFVLIKSKRKPLLQALMFTAVFAVISGILVGLSSKDTEAKGVIATNIPAIAQLQSQLGIIQKDIAEIKEATKKTAKTVAKIEKTSKQTAENTKKIATTLEAIQKGFSKLANTGGIIQTPERPEEHYHNARVYEQKGDYINARKSYNAFFAFKLDLLDPHLRYQTFLKVQEGRAGALEVYNALYELDERPIVDFARIRLYPSAQRVTLINEFIKNNPDFAPAYYELSKEFSKARKGVQSRNDKQEELKALETFKSLNEKGKFLKYFVDKEVAAKWLKDADTRLTALAALKRTASEAPVKISANYSNSGWIVTTILGEKAKEIFYRTGEEGEFKSTGFTQYVDPATGFKTPQSYFTLPTKIDATTLHFKYTDVSGEMRGPFSINFDPAQELVKSQKQILKTTKNGWVSFRDYDGKLLVYFTHLISYRCSLAEVKYMLDGDEPTQNHPLPDCNPKDPISITSDAKILIEAPLDTKYMTVKLTFKDGTESKLQRFDR